MSEANKKKKKRLRGFPSVVAKNLEPVNDIEHFQKKYKDQKINILLNANDGKWAALVNVENGKLEIEGLKNGDKKYMKKLYKEHNCDAKLDTTLPMFLKIVMGELGLLGIVIKIITRKIKVKGIGKLLKLLDIFSILDHEKNKSA